MTKINNDDKGNGSKDLKGRLVIRGDQEVDHDLVRQEILFDPITRKTTCLLKNKVISYSITC